MKKNDLLKSIGFSDEFIEHLENSKKDGLSCVEQHDFSDRRFSFESNDTSELFVDKQIKTDFNNIFVK